MFEICASDLISLLQATIAPVAMISGVGLILLSMTNRYGRAIDRIRLEVKEFENCNDEQKKEAITEQLKILYKRAELLRWVIVFASSSVFLIALSIASIFSIQFAKVPLEEATIITFGLSLLCLIVSLVLFIEDIAVSLKAVKVELRRFIK
ncbi:MAG: DUF2721 domain-containing protein [Armatimonadota bacterium]